MSYLIRFAKPYLWLSVFAVGLFILAIQPVQAAATAQGVSLGTASDCDLAQLTITLTASNVSSEYGSFSDENGNVLFEFQNTSSIPDGTSTISFFIPGQSLPEGSRIIAYAYVGETPPASTNTAEFLVVYECSNSGNNQIIDTCFGSYGTCDYIAPPVNPKAPKAAGAGTSKTISYPTDGRINWQYGDLEVVVYRHDQGAVAYCYNKGQTNVGMFITQDVIDAADPDQPQHIPVLEVNEPDCRTAFYILDGGEYQINIRTVDNKLYEIIADNIHFDDEIKRYYDPNERR